MRTLVIIPAFNECENIEHVVHKVTALNYDYLIINDCSTDDTAKILDEKRLNHLDLVNNVGLASVTQVGFKYAAEYDYDAVVVVDGDGQHLPEYIAPLLGKIEEGYDYVIGSRFVSEKKPFTLRMIGSRILCFFIRLKTGIQITDPTSGMRALGKKVCRDFSQRMNYIAEPDALVSVLRKKRKVIEVQVKMEDRENGESYFMNPVKSVKYMFSVLFSIIFVQW